MIEYSKKYLDKLIDEKKKKIVAIIVLSALLFVTLILSIIFVDLESALVYKILDSVVLTILGWVIIYLLIFDLLPLLRFIVHVQKTIYSKREKFRVKVLNISSIITITKGNKGYCLLCEDEKRKYKFYYHEDFHPIQFVESDLIEIDVKNNYIIFCEVLKYEKEENGCNIR